MQWLYWRYAWRPKFLFAPLGSKLSSRISQVSGQTISPPHFVYDFSRKIFFMLYSINWSNFILWLPLFCLYVSFFNNLKYFFFYKHYSENKIIKNVQRRTLRFEKIFGNEKAFKIDGKCFLFYLKSFFHSQVI